MKSSFQFIRSWTAILTFGAVIASSHSVHAQDGLIALYTFHEGSGTTIHDVSEVGDPLNLTIPNPSGITWLPGGGISINEGQIIGSGVPATKIIEAVQQSSEITIETWIKPHSLNQLGPARVVTMSAHTTDRNFTLGLENVTWTMRIRGPGDNNGLPQLPDIAVVRGDNPPVTAALRLMHVVFTRDIHGADKFYVDGQVVVDRVLPGDFSGWNSGHHLALGAELTGERPWLGEMHKVAIYDRALSAAEIGQKLDELMPALEIADLTPAHGALFHPAANGIEFRAVALRNNTIAQNDVELILNGQDRSADLVFAGSNTDWQVSFPDIVPDQRYTGEVSITDNEGRTRQVSLQFETFSLREDGLVALYTFEEGAGTIIRDRSGVGNPLDLVVSNPAAVQWMAGGGLSVEAPARIVSSGLAGKVQQAIQQSQSVTLEAWISSANAALTAARIVTISSAENNPIYGVNLRNMSLMQQGSAYQTFLRTSQTTPTGAPALPSPAMDVLFPAHVVYTRDAVGQARLHVNGVEVATQTRAGDFSNWFDGYRLGLAGEINGVGTNPWLGQLYRVAIYNRALSTAEIQGQFNEFAGSDGTPPAVPQNVTVTSGAVFSWVTWDDPPEAGRLGHEVERNGEVVASFVTGKSFVDRSVVPMTSYSYRVRAVDFLKNASAFSSPVQTSTTDLSEAPGVVRAEFFTDIPGTSVIDLWTEPKFFNNQPDVTMSLPSLETPQNWGDEYGVRVSGWFIPPQTGQYVFFLSSDDHGEFWLNDSASPDSPFLVAEEPGWSTFRNWIGTAEGRSAAAPENRSDTFLGNFWPTGNTISLTMGQSYYFEALMKEGTGGDHLTVTYKLAGESDPENGTPTRMTGNVIRSLADPAFIPPTILAGPESRTVALGDPVTLTVEIAPTTTPGLNYQWLLGGIPVPGATDSTHAVPSFQTQDAGEYSVLVSNIAGSATSATALIQALPSTEVSMEVAIVDGRLVLSWPASSEGFVPQQTGSLTVPIQWSPVDVDVVQQDGNNTVTIDPEVQARYFRLVQ